MIISESWEKGARIAHFQTDTSGPEGSWEVEMKKVEEDGVFYFVVYDPFSDRLMWFDNNAAGDFESRLTFRNLVSVAMCDANTEWPKRGDYHA